MNQAPIRCTDCKWIHEADSLAKNSFMGVELCPKHNTACNAHKDLVKLFKKVQSLLDSRDMDRLILESDQLQAEVEEALAKAEVK